MTIPKAATDSNEETELYMKVSLWLLPPPHLRHSLSQQIVKYAKSNEKSHPFEPHVTVVGGVPCESPEQLDEWRCKLKSALSDTGPVPCRFRKEVLSLYEDDDSLVWNQACICVMEKSDAFMRLIQKVRETLELKEEFSFRPPLYEPHYSFFHGKANAPPLEQVAAPPDFEAAQVALWSTYPASLEGVPSWKELARFDLC